jgi:hypothetical protein
LLKRHIGGQPRIGYPAPPTSLGNAVTPAFDCRRILIKTLFSGVERHSDPSLAIDQFDIATQGRLELLSVQDMQQEHLPPWRMKEGQGRGTVAEEVAGMQ